MSEQLALFERARPEPEGLRYAADFVSPTIEQELILGIRALPLQPFQFGEFEGKRRVASFGFRYDYDLRQLQRAEPIPAWLAEIVANVETFGGPATRSEGSLYRIRRGGWHRLAPRQAAFRRDIRPIAGIRLQVCKRACKTWDRFTIDAEARSLYMMTGASRQIWEHSIPAVEAPRYSITFRTMRNAPDVGTPS